MQACHSLTVARRSHLKPVSIPNPVSDSDDNNILPSQFRQCVSITDRTFAFACWTLKGTSSFVMDGDEADDVQTSHFSFAIGGGTSFSHEDEGAPDESTS